MRIALVISCILALAIGAAAQNLVPNPSFESNTGLPTGPGQFNRVVGWNQVNNGPAFTWPYASPDYLHTSGSGGMGLPVSTFGTVSPYQGSAVVGGALWYTTANFREYIACQLTSPMTIGQSYDVTIHVANGTNSFMWGIYGPQIAFSTAPLFQSTHEPISYTPQLVPGSIIYSTGWTTLTYNFSATQAFQHMTIGNFNTDANTVKQALGGGINGSYYFYDGMSVTQAIVLDENAIALAGQTAQKANLVEWADADHPVAGSKAYSVWRSQDGGQFRMIGETQVGDAPSFRDEAPYYGMNWYKVRRDNLDGSVSWSNVVQLENNQESELHVLSVYPNPATSEVNVMMEHPFVEEVFAELYDATGRLVREEHFPAAGLRLSVFSLPVQDLSAGMYQLRIHAGSAFATRPVMVSGQVR